MSSGVVDDVALQAADVKGLHKRSRLSGRKSGALKTDRIMPFDQTNYFAGNLIWNPYHLLTVGTEFLYGWRVNKNGASRNAPRIIFSAQYNFIRAQSEEACMEQVDEQSLDK